jgi:hypothetical protein
MLSCVALALVAGELAAQDVSVQALTDRTTIRENESFTYTVRVEGSVRGDPSVTGLSENFDILNRSTSTRIQIINGRTEQIAEWQYQLMPRQVGTFVIPPAQIAGSVSNAVEIEVQGSLPPGDELADIFMEVEALPEQAYVQSQIIFTLRLFVGIGTGRATLTTPEVDGVEAIVERLGEDANYSSVRGGRNFVVRERSYAVFAQDPGTLTIGPVVFEVMVIPNRGFSRVQRYSSDTVQVEVLPAVAPPAEYPQAVWLPARSVELSERWSEPPDTLEMGIPRTRALTIEANGLLETQLPDLEIVQADGIRQYADQPELDRSVSPAGMTAERTERYAVIAQRAGNIELPAVELPWWNVATRQWEVARIEPRTIEVTPSTEAVAPVSEAPEAAPAQTQVVVEHPRLAWWLSAIFGMGWLLTAAAWWRAARHTRRSAEPADSGARGRFDGSARNALQRLQRACAAHDARAARTALLDWAAREAAFEGCHSLGVLAERLPADAGAAVRDLERHLYASGAGDWDGTTLAGYVTSLPSSRQTAAKAVRDPLPSLYS